MGGPPLTTLQFWAPWLRAELPRGRARLQVLTGATSKRCKVANTAARPETCENRLRAQVCALAKRVSCLHRVKQRAAMVEAALVDIFESLGDVVGGDVAADYAEVPRALAQEGLFVDVNLLYNDPTPMGPNAPRNHVPNSVAAAGLGPAGRVYIAKSLWGKCVSGLRAIYRRGGDCAAHSLGYATMPGLPRSCSTCSNPST